MDYTTIRFEEEDGIATITLDRPEKLNAFNLQMVNELLDAFDRVDETDSVRAVIVTGAGRGFCAGADLSEGAETFPFQSMEEGDLVDAEGHLRYSQEALRDGGGLLTLRIFRCLKPMIAAINGPAVGVGATMTLAMDVRLASENSKFGFVFAKRGTVPEAASSWFLPRIVGISRALDWCFSARIFPAAEALGAGLVNAVHPQGDLLPAARRLAASYASESAPVSIALIRQMMWRGLTAAHPMDAHRVDSRGLLSRWRSADGREGIAAFQEKRQPVYPDRVSSDMPDYFPWWDEPSYR